MAFNKIFLSLHGKQVGMTSSGGLAFEPTTSSGYNHAAEISSAGVFQSSIDSFGSTIGDMTVQLLRSMVETISSSAATLVNYGLSVISSDVINVSVLKLSAPAVGVLKEIYGDSSASTISLNTTSSDITFGASVASSAFVFDQVGGVRGTSLVLRGISTSRWALLGRKVLA